jgi:hypothetical protein
MKKPLFLLAGIFGLLAFAGCTWGDAVETCTSPDNPINVRVGEQFNIAVELTCTDPTVWEQEYDEDMLALRETVCATCRAGEAAMTAGWTAITYEGPATVSLNRFEALQPGETEIIISYRFPGDDSPSVEETYTVVIEPAG